MSSARRIVLSDHLDVVSADAGSNARVIENTLTGQRLSLNDQAVKILEAFQSPRTFASAAARLGVTGRAPIERFRRLLEPLLKASFLVDSEAGTSPAPPAPTRSGGRRRDFSMSDQDLFTAPETTFISCPIASVSGIQPGSFVIAGIGIDYATTGHPGARFGPDRLREVSNRFIRYERDVLTLEPKGWFSADRGRTIFKGVRFADAGNVTTRPSEDPSVLYQRCYRSAQSIYERKSLPVFIGGDHSISAPLVRACQDAYGDVTLVHLDAHTDSASWDPATEHHHGNVMSRVLHENPGLKIYQFGVRGYLNSPPRHERCHLVSQREIDADLPEVLARRIPRNRTCYISVDVDVLDPAVAPGTGTPVPLGMSAKTLLSLLEAIAERNRVVGIDVAELCPPLDIHDATASLVFHVLMSLLDRICETQRVGNVDAKKNRT